VLQSPVWKNCNNELGACYEFYHEAKAQSAAETFCRESANGPNGQLASIVDNRTQLYIQGLLGNFKSTEYWTAGQLQTKMHQWRWINDTLYNSGTIRLVYTEWVRK